MASSGLQVAGEGNCFKQFFNVQDSIDKKEARSIFLGKRLQIFHY